MGLEIIEDFEREKSVQELIEKVFIKAQVESRKKPIHGLANYLSNKLFEDFNFSVDVNTFTRYYKGYISRKGKRQHPTDDILQILCRYLGYENFKDFEEKREYGATNKELRKEIELLKKKLRHGVIVFVVFKAVLALSLLFVVLRYYQKNCMVWIDDHYEEVRCSGLTNETVLNRTIIKKLKRIYPCDTTTFFKDGVPMVWYNKSNSEISYFTYYGKHPTNSKPLKPVTSAIINAYVVPCDSIE